MSHLNLERARRPILPHAIRVLAVPIILFWVLVTVVVNTVAPQLELVGEERSAPMMPVDAPSMNAMSRLGHDFHQYDFNSTVMIVLEAGQPQD
jgi:RND superfamily putative drug exporter